jgi:hypothetical protein
MVKVRYKNPFDKETELAAHFIEEAKRHGWKAYPETEGFDVLLVATESVTGHFLPGDQIGVQAKLKPTVEVLYQALPRKTVHPGPKYYAVLVPRATPEFRDLAKRLRIKVFEATQKSWPAIRGQRGDLEWRQGPVKQLLDPPSLWHLHEHRAPCWVPDVEVVLPAGVPSPKQLTPWKFKAVRLALHGVAKGYLTTKDFKEFDVSMARWVQKQWIVPGDFVVEGGSRRRKYILNELRRPPHIAFPEITEAIQRGVIP